MHEIKFLKHDHFETIIHFIDGLDWKYMFEIIGLKNNGV